MLRHAYSVHSHYPPPPTCYTVNSSNGGYRGGGETVTSKSSHFHKNTTEGNIKRPYGKMLSNVLSHAFTLY